MSEVNKTPDDFGDAIEYAMTVTSAESHADVIADMHKKYPASPNCEPTVSGQFVHDEMEWLAKRLEAAHKREIEDAERRGNHAAMGAVADTLRKVGPLYDAESIGRLVALRDAVARLIELGVIPQQSPTVCMPIILGEGYNPESKTCAVCRGGSKKICKAIHAVKTALADAKGE